MGKAVLPTSRLESPRMARRLCRKPGSAAYSMITGERGRTVQTPPGPQRATYPEGHRGAVCLLYPKKKPNCHFPGNPAIFSSPEETRSFPSPPLSGFGSLLEAHKGHIINLLSRYFLSNCKLFQCCPVNLSENTEEDDSYRRN